MLATVRHTPNHSGTVDHIRCCVSSGILAACVAQRNGTHTTHSPTGSCVCCVRSAACRPALSEQAISAVTCVCYGVSACQVHRCYGLVASLGDPVALSCPLRTVPAIRIFGCTAGLPYPRGRHGGNCDRSARVGVPVALTDKRTCVNVAGCAFFAVHDDRSNSR